MAVNDYNPPNDNNPLYDAFYYYLQGYRTVSGKAVTGNYWADFLFGDTSPCSLANYFVANLLQQMDNL